MAQKEVLVAIKVAVVLGHDITVHLMGGLICQLSMIGSPQPFCHMRNASKVSFSEKVFVKNQLNSFFVACR